MQRRGDAWKSNSFRKKNHCQGNHPWYERPTKMLGLFRTWSRAVRGRSWQRFQLLEPILRRFSCHRDVAFAQISAKDVSRRPPLNILMQQEHPGNLVHFFHATGNIEVFCWNLMKFDQTGLRWSEASLYGYCASHDFIRWLDKHVRRPRSPWKASRGHQTLWFVQRDLSRMMATKSIKHLQIIYKCTIINAINVL
jgi:hypothetical protein